MNRLLSPLPKLITLARLSITTIAAICFRLRGGEVGFGGNSSFTIVALAVYRSLCSHKKYLHVKLGATRLGLENGY